MNNVTNWCLAMAIAVGLASDAFAQSNTIQLRNGANTTLLKSASSGGAVTLTMPAASGTLLSGSGTTDKVVRWSASGLTDGTFSDNGTGTLSTTLSTLLTTSNSTIGIKSTGSSNGNHTYLYISNPPAVWTYFNTATIESGNNNSVGFILNANGARGMIGLETWSGGGNYLQSQDNGDLGEMQFWIPDGLGTSGTSSGGSGSPIVAFYTGKAQSGLRVGNFVLGGSSTASQLRFMEPSGSGSNYSAFKAQAQAADVTYTLPAADGTNGYVLTTNGSGTLSWAAASGGATSIDGLSDAKSGGANFTNSLLLGHESVTPTGAEQNTGVGLGGVLQALTSGDQNTAVGYGAADGVSSGFLLTAIGYNALGAASSAARIVAIGAQAGESTTTGAYSVFIGNQAAQSFTGASNVVAVGYGAMRLATGGDNVAIGTEALNGLTTGTNNVAIGAYAGNTNVTTGSGNVFIGDRVYPSTNVSNKLYIHNGYSATDSPLIYGDFSGSTLTFNGSTTTTGKTTFSPPGSAKAITATTSTGAGAPDIAAFTNTYDKVAVTATTTAGYVQLPAGTDGQVLYLRLAFTADASNSTVTVVNSNNTNTAMVYDGTGADVIVAHMLYTTGEGWVVFSALEYDN